MRILFLSHYFPPEVNAPASRTFEHCREWVRNGHQVTVVTCAPNHPRGRVYAGYRNRLWQRERRDGIDIVRLATYITANEGFARRSLGYLSFLIACICAAPFLPRADVLITTSPQFFNGLAGYPVKLLKRIPWVLEIRDLWPDSVLAVGAVKNRQLIRWLAALERFAYRKCDHIVPLTEAFRRDIVGKGIAPEKISVVRNGADLALFDNHADPQELRARLGLEGKFVVSYVGTHGMAHGLETVLHAAAQLRGQQRIAFLLVGDGAERQRLLGLRAQLGLTNVTMLGQQPKELMPQIWALSDASLVVLRKLPLFETVIPSKIFEIMAMERPIILAVGGEAREIVEEGEAGLVIEPESSADLCAAVLRLANDQALARQLGANGRHYVTAYFDRRALARRFEGVLDELLARAEQASAPAPAVSAARPSGASRERDGRIAGC
jgi:glycosyltransferase involved in cell wall biosynthesis